MPKVFRALSYRLISSLMLTHGPTFVSDCGYMYQFVESPADVPFLVNVVKHCDRSSADSVPA